MARKRIRLQDDSSRIKDLENKLTESIASNASLNSLADLTSLAASLDEPHSVLKAIYASYRVFVLLISKGCLSNPTDEQTNVVRTWIFERLDEYLRLLYGLLQDEESLLRVCHPETSLLVISYSAQTSALDILMSLLKHLSTSLSKSSPQPQFHVPHFKKVIDALLTCPPSERGGKKLSLQGELSNKLDAEVRDQFVAKWLNVYVDVRWFFLRDAEYDFDLCLCPPPAINKSLVSGQCFHLLHLIRTPMSPKTFFPSSKGWSHFRLHSRN